MKNEVIIKIKEGQYKGYIVDAVKVIAQDGVRYRAEIDGKVIGFMPKKVRVVTGLRNVNKLKTK